MSNNYFQFKQFTIQQDRCAMKVTTDGCLFGAVVAEEIQKAKVKIQNILDIGAGTGLLSLMIAQVCDATIDAIEINAAAGEQATENIMASPFKEKIKIINEDLNQFETALRYGFIVSNPPFFEDDLKSPHTNKNAAKHSDSLTLTQLLNKVTGLLSEDGIVAVLLPYHRNTWFINEAEKLNLYLLKNISVKQSVAHDYFRSILFFSRKKTATQSFEIIIKTGEGNYTDEFIGLLKPYYLYL